MSEKEIVSRINTEFNNKVRRRTLWSRIELFELHKNVCDVYLNPVKRKNLAMVRDKYDDVN